LYTNKRLVLQYPNYVDRLAFHYSDNYEKKLKPWMVNNITNIKKKKPTTSHIKSLTLNKKMTTTYGVGSSGPGLGQTHKRGRVKLVNGIPTTS
jgi:hypothetical protein